MKRAAIAAAIVSAVMFSSCAETQPPEIVRNSPIPAELSAVSQTDGDDASAEGYTPLNYETQKGFWLSYIELADMLTDSAEEFEAEFQDACENISSLGCNTVYVHVRAFGDAFYDSSLYTLSKYVPTDGGGQALYDPLEIMTAVAHEYGLSFHAWINPLRCDTQRYMERMKGSVIYEWYSEPEKYPEYISKPDGDDHYWLNPSIAEVRELISEGAAEIAENYDVDGIHIDDYFYPTTDADFDEETYIAANSAVSLSDWRKKNCSEMVSELYSAVKSCDERILFGVSPQGNIDNNYSQLYADVEEWCSQDGYLDYIAPQIYFGYENPICPFTDTLCAWSDIVTNENVSLICGVAAYKLETEDEFINSDGIIASQIKDALDNASYSGFAIYGYGALFSGGDRSDTELEMICGVLE